jgi:hypothetical protein
MGDGLYVAGTVTVFNNIPWTVNKYYLTIDFVINGVTSSTALEQLVTVPYAFHAGTAGNGISSVADNGNGTLTFTYANGGTYTTPALAGLTGPQGPTGSAGPQGANGLSAYELWVAQGNTGTVTDFLNQSSYNIWLAQGNTGTQQQFLNSLVGPQGPAGTNGTNGLNALIKTTSEPAGANCTNGGTKIETGLDANGNGVLDVGEVNAAQTQYVCNQYSNTSLSNGIAIGIGDYYGGGIVTYILKPNDPGYDPNQLHGIIASVVNLCSGCPMHNSFQNQGSVLGTVSGSLF